MERLTERSVNGTPICFYRGETTESEFINKCKNILRKCCRYEDTGLEPEEIKAMKNNGGWIPVNERLPEVDETVLIYILGCHEYGAIDISYIRNRENNNFCAISGEYDLTEVVAWQPLPEPYRPQED